MEVTEALTMKDDIGTLSTHKCVKNLEIKAYGEGIQTFFFKSQKSLSADFLKILLTFFSFMFEIK